MATYRRKQQQDVTAEQAETWTEVETAAGTRTVQPGDWIVTDGEGQRTILSAAEFSAQYAEHNIVAPDESGLAVNTTPSDESALSVQIPAGESVQEPTVATEGPV